MQTPLCCEAIPSSPQADAVVEYLARRCLIRANWNGLTRNTRAGRKTKQPKGGRGKRNLYGELAREVLMNDCKVKKDDVHASAHVL